MSKWIDLIPKPEIPPKDWTDLMVVSATVFGEARGEKLEGKIAVSCVIRNRVHNPGWWGNSWSTVCLKPFQFSSWNSKDANRDKLSDPLKSESAETWLDCLSASRLVIEPGLFSDVTDGATHYHDISIAKPKNWTNFTETEKIGRFIFYKGR